MNFHGPEEPAPGISPVPVAGLSKEVLPLVANLCYYCVGS